LLEFIKKGEDMLSQINYETLPSFYLGLEKGEIRGIEKGKLEGEKQKAIEIAKMLLSIGDDMTKISKVTGLTIEDIRNLL
jgi:predicted transposase/invertase (TIGR01784 family)